MAEAVELSQAAANERAEPQPEEVPETVTIEDAEYAFLIYKKATGEIFVSPDINVPVEVERQASSDELKATLAKIIDDIRAQEVAAITAKMVVAHQMELAMKAAAARENQQLLQQLPGLAR
jgi:tRNA(Ser,Leu) C12 N-acetylase TAN1